MVVSLAPPDPEDLNDNTTQSPRNGMPVATPSATSSLPANFREAWFRQLPSLVSAGGAGHQGNKLHHYLVHPIIPPKFLTILDAESNTINPAILKALSSNNNASWSCQSSSQWPAQFAFPWHYNIWQSLIQSRPPSFSPTMWSITPQTTNLVPAQTHNASPQAFLTVVASLPSVGSSWYADTTASHHTSQSQNIQQTSPFECFVSPYYYQKLAMCQSIY